MPGCTSSPGPRAAGPNASSENKRDALERLVRFYEAAGEAEQAAEWKQKLADLTQAEARKGTTPADVTAEPKR